MEARIKKWGNSLAVRIPKSIAKEIKVVEGDEVDLQVGGGGLLIRPQSPRYRLSDLVRKITGNNLHDETDWGSATGREIW